MKANKIKFLDIFIVWGIWAIILGFIDKLIGHFSNYLKDYNDLIFITKYLSSYILLFVLLFSIPFFKYKKNIFEFYSIKKTSIKNVFFSIFIGLILASVVICISNFYNISLKTNKSIYMILYYVLVSTTIGVVIEEMFTRGLLYNYLINKLNFIATIIIINVWFVVAHMHLNKENMIIFTSVIFIMGLILTFQRYYFKNLLPAIITHSSFNLFTGLYTLYISI